MKEQNLKPTITKADKVKSVIHFTLSSNEGKLTSKRYKKFEAFYDDRGNLIESVSYEAGKITNWLKYSYDENSELIEYTTHKGYGYDKSRFTPVTHKAPSTPWVDETVEKPTIELAKEGKKGESLFYKNGKNKGEKN